MKKDFNNEFIFARLINTLFPLCTATAAQQFPSRYLKFCLASTAVEYLYVYTMGSYNRKMQKSGRSADS